MERRVERNQGRLSAHGSSNVQRRELRKRAKETVALTDSYHGRDRAARYVIKVAGCTARLHAGGLSRHSPINGEGADKEDKLDRDAVAGTKGPRGDKTGGTWAV